MSLLLALIFTTAQPAESFAVPAPIECPAVSMPAVPARKVTLNAADVQGVFGPLLQLHIAVSTAEVGSFGRLNFLRIGGKPFAGGLMSRRLDDDGQTFFVLSFEREMLDILVDGLALELVEKDGPGMSLKLAAADAAPLAECLAVHSPIVDGAAPAALGRRQTFVETSPSQPLQVRSRGYSGDGYPSRALQEEREGETRIRLIIGTDGRVADCEVAISSGHTDLDAAACRAARKLSYYPATNAAAEPIESKGEQIIKWEIPQ